MDKNEVVDALCEVKDLYKKILGRPAPEVDPRGFVPFPPGSMPLELALRAVEDLRRVAEQLELAPAPVAWVPPADCLVGPETFLVRMEIPGVAREDLQILFRDGQCVVRGERKQPDGAREAGFVSLERPWGPFERRFALPMGSDPDKIKAVCRDGVLEIRAAVAVPEAPRQMTVEAA